MPDALTQTERLILLNQYRILSILDPNEKDAYEESISVLQNGYEKHYERLHPGLNTSIVTAEQSSFVHQSLSMFDRLENAIDDGKFLLSDGLKSKIRFVGFSENYEPEYYSYANFVIHLQKSFQRYKDLPLNSHVPMKDQYASVLSRWNQLPQSDRDNLTSEIIERLLK